MNKQGAWYATVAYVLWGVLPIYWKQLHNIPPLEIIGYRILLSFVTVSFFLMLGKNWGKFIKAVTRPGVLKAYGTASLLIGINWLIYIWAINSNYIIETSLGYFINPLLSILLGVIVLKEHLRIGQWIPVILAALGMIYMTLTYGKVPWIALSLALSFGLYGLVKKKAPLNSLYGLTIETGFLLIPSLIYLSVVFISGSNAFLHTDLKTDLLVILSGIVTIIPLLLFASAAQKISLSLVGILQYIAPTLQFLIGYFIYREAITHNQLLGFVLVWIALAFFFIEGIINNRRHPLVQFEKN